MGNAVFVDAGNDPAYGKFTAPGITVPFFDIREPRLTPSYLDAVAKHPGITGVGYYADASWRKWLPVAFAQWVSDTMLEIGWRGNAVVCLDIETHDISGFVVPCLLHWRQIRPTRATWWTFEGMQGGLFTQTDLANIVGTGIRLAPQFYRGDMTPLEHSPVLDLLMAGFSGGIIDGMYDAAALPYRWRGFGFTQGRLP